MGLLFSLDHKPLGGRDGANSALASWIVPGSIECILMTHDQIDGNQIAVEWEPWWILSSSGSHPRDCWKLYWVSVSSKVKWGTLTGSSVQFILALKFSGDDESLGTEMVRMDQSYHQSISLSPLYNDCWILDLQGREGKILGINNRSSSSITAPFNQTTLFLRSSWRQKGTEALMPTRT